MNADTDVVIFGAGGSVIQFTGREIRHEELFEQTVAGEQPPISPRGSNIVLTARSKDRLETLAAELRAARRIKVEVITLELAADRRARANSMRSDRSPGSANAIKASGQMRHTNGPIPHARGPSGFFGPPAKTRVPWTVY
jgi:hypothetical protein